MIIQQYNLNMTSTPNNIFGQVIWYCNILKAHAGSDRKHKTESPLYILTPIFR